MALTGCFGQASTAGAAGNQTAIPLPADAQPVASGLRRLSRAEYDATLKDLLQDATSSGFAMLPADPTDPFDNDYLGQLPSGALVEAVEKLAQDAAKRALSNAVVKSSILPCSPSGPADSACFDQFVRTFGRRVLRRPVTAEELTRYRALLPYAQEANDFNFALELAITALLQEPDFLYRVELGTAVPGRAGVFRLTPFELATRLSFFLWGSTPPEWLLDAASAGQLSTTEQVHAAAERLLQDPRARARVSRFHALWLGFHRLPHALNLTQAMQAESDALIQRTIFEQPSSYLDLFRSTDTYANTVLATHYGLTKTDSNPFSWISYGASGRKGILSHGSVLSAGAKFDDTSPTQRGIFVRTRLLCEEVPKPPANANVDDPPTSPTSNCKVDRYAAHASVGDCKSCHSALDPIGFGLEKYDRAGQFRTHDLNEPSCTISGQGFLQGVGEFSGPAQLGDLLVQTGKLEACVVTQLYRFAIGRKELTEERSNVSRLTHDFQESGYAFKSLLMNIVSDETFAFRLEEQEAP
jgi:hypothetical protein